MVHTKNPDMFLKIKFKHFSGQGLVGIVVEVRSYIGSWHQVMLYYRGQ